MKKKIIPILISSFLLFTNSITVSASSNIYKPTSNDIAGNYIVVSNESTDINASPQRIGSLNELNTTRNFRSNNLINAKLSNNKIYLNKSVLPKEISTDTPKAEVKNSPVEFSVLNSSKSFWAVNNTNGNYYKVTATLKYSGTRCEVWVADNKINNTDAIKLGKEFDNYIYPKITSNFGQPCDFDNNNKINLLCYDIKDSFTSTGSYIAGYFDSIDLFSDVAVSSYGRHSNEGELLYIDTYPLMYTGSTVNVNNAYDTIAHEFQHLVNFSENIVNENGELVPTWINEGLSEAASQIYSGKIQTDRITYLNNSNSITNGHSILNWDDSNPLPNYSLSYLFFQYLRIQCGQGNKIFKEIINDKANDEKAIKNVIHKYINPNMSLGKFLTNFKMALVRKDTTGLYGFKNETGFNTINVPTCSSYDSTTSLEPGASIVLDSRNKVFKRPTNAGKNIVYLGNYEIFDKADVNKDSKVNSLDLSYIATNYNKSTTYANWHKDTNRDGIFDLYDLVTVGKKIK